MIINITMDPKNKKRRADRTFYDLDSDYETRTMTMNWPRFLLVESGDDSLPVTKLSPFAIDKGFQALISGRLRSIKRLRNGTFLVECDTKKQSDLPQVLKIGRQANDSQHSSYPKLLAWCYSLP